MTSFDESDCGDSETPTNLVAIAEKTRCILVADKPKPHGHGL